MHMLGGLRHLNLCGCEALIELPAGIAWCCLQTLPIFIMSRHLNLIPALRCWELRGELKIKHLERVRAVSEAKEANLKNKIHIKLLGLCWGHDGADMIINPAIEYNIVRFQERKHQISEASEEPDPDDAPFDPNLDDTRSNPNLATEVLECLTPPKNLMNIFVVGYPGFKFPHWMLPNLTKVVLINCRECIKLPTLGHLPSLRTLFMNGIYSVEYIGQEFYGENAAVLFQSLEELFMQDFPLLREWAGLDSKELFPKLSKLTLKKCPKLISVPSFTSIHHLQLQGCDPRILRCMGKLKFLLSLDIQGFEGLLDIPVELFKANHLLEYLKISSCPKLQSLAPELEELVALKSLSIQWCRELNVLPNGFQKLTALESLEICECINLVALPDNATGGLRSLKTLSLENCNRLDSISSGLQYLTALEDLTIMYCPSLAFLPDTMKHLSALRSLTIISFPQIEVLPEGFKVIESEE